MPTIAKKQLAEYEQLRRDRDNGRLLTPDGLRFICEANKLDPEVIGKHILCGALQPTPSSDEEFPFAPAPFPCDIRH